jgi:Complex I intermediate-associated protein 30 (CIA30)
MSIAELTTRTSRCSFLSIVVWLNSLKTTACIRPQISYRATFDVPIATGSNEDWTTVQIPFSQFVGHRIEGDPPLQTSALTRIGILAIGRAMNNVQLAVSGVRFYGKRI